jgi:hypothetical protein
MSARKTFNTRELNCGFAVIPNQELRRRYEKEASLMAPSPNALGYAARSRPGVLPVVDDRSRNTASAAALGLKVVHASLDVPSISAIDDALQQDSAVLSVTSCPPTQEPPGLGYSLFN